MSNEFAGSFYMVMTLKLTMKHSETYNETYNETQQKHMTQLTKSLTRRDSSALLSQNSANSCNKSS